MIRIRYAVMSSIEKAHFIVFHGIDYTNLRIPTIKPSSNLLTLAPAYEWEGAEANPNLDGFVSTIHPSCGFLVDPNPNPNPGMGGPRDQQPGDRRTYFQPGC